MAGVGKCERAAFTRLRDIGLFLRSARSDARLEVLRQRSGSSEFAFDRLYADAPHNDPWWSSAPQYEYQRRKYDEIVRLLPNRAYRRALDVGCGLGLLTERLASVAANVVGVDISSVALVRAAERLRRFEYVQVRQGDIMDLDAEFNQTFDLVVVADTIYYLPPPIQDETLKVLARRLAQLLTPDGVMVIANHYFPMPTADTRLSRRIHDAFRWSPELSVVTEHYRAFFLVSVLEPLPQTY